jgi:hypothetical protein
MAHINNGSGCPKCGKTAKVKRVGKSDRSIIRSSGRRKCSYCERYFKLDKFNKNNHAQDGLSSVCKKCEAIIRAKYRSANIEKIRNRDNAKGKDKWAKFKEVHKEEFEQRAIARAILSEKKRIMRRIGRSMRACIKSHLITKSSGGRLIRLLGCTIEYFMFYIESMFIENMTWDNYGYYGWHLDHIIPCSMFDMTNEEEVNKCFHYSNYQPLWRFDNQSKGGRRIGR